MLGRRRTALQQQRLAQKVECRGVDIRIQPLGPGDREAQERHIALTILAPIVDVGAVDGEGGDGLAQDRLQNVIGEVARLADWKRQSG